MRDSVRRRRAAFRMAGAIALLPLLLSCSSVLMDLEIAPVERVRVAPDSVDLPIGLVARLRAFPLDSTGAYRPGGTTVWATSDALIATVNDTGVVTGVATGTVTITASALGLQGTARVRVGPAPLISLATDSIQFDATIGQGDPEPQAIAVANGGGLSLAGLAVDTIDYGSGPSAWLTAQLDTTVAPATLTVQALPGTITQPGIYLATVPVSAALAGNSPRSLRVALVLAAP